MWYQFYRSQDDIRNALIRFGRSGYFLYRPQAINDVGHDGSNLRTCFLWHEIWSQDYYFKEVEAAIYNNESPSENFRTKLHSKMKYARFYCAVILLLCQLSFCHGEVTLVTRQWYGEQFAIGRESCTRDPSVCTAAKASCSLKRGLCECKDHDNPHFRNPSIELRNGVYRYGSSYGCITKELFLANFGRCSFS